MEMQTYLRTPRQSVNDSNRSQVTAQGSISRARIYHACFRKQNLPSHLEYMHSEVIGNL